ncbi:hypothetical protein FOMPIDRAFT_88969 [Fomitopsis schrenkii]|uniref:Uncharacterized protein n=1 Tax=Fomitopsis schrenkii TaxID=2126942 RepID=S8EBN7_FOMSC|nr:hypothetical protein FOMPIDRAFT_88969 [Fomitopsis schrenkii]
MEALDPDGHVRIRLWLVQGSEVKDSCRDAFMNPDDTVQDFLHTLSTRYRIQEYDIDIWKPRDSTVTATDAGRVVLSRSPSLAEYGNDLSRFCANITGHDHRRIYLSDARSRSQKNPVYVVVVPKPPAPAVVPPPPPDHDDEEDDTSGAMLQSG